MVFIILNVFNGSVIRLYLKDRGVDPIFARLGFYPKRKKDLRYLS